MPKSKDKNKKIDEEKKILDIYIKETINSIAPKAPDEIKLYALKEATSYMRENITEVKEISLNSMKLNFKSSLLEFLKDILAPYLNKGVKLERG